MTISRMQQPRQQYGLGSFVKKIGKKLKKAAKSPLGKIALGIGAASLIPGAGFMGKFNTAKNFLGGVGGYSKPGQGLLKKGLLGKLGLTEGGGDFSLTGLGKIASIGLPSLIAGMGADKEGEGGFSDSGDRKEGLENYLRYYYGNMNPNANQSEIDEFVKVNMYADGGRVNYREGTAVPGGGGGTIMPVTLPDFSVPDRPITNLPGGPGTGIDQRRPAPEQSEGDKLYQDVLDYLKSDSDKVEAIASPDVGILPVPYESAMLETEKDSSLQILKERGYDTDNMNFMKGDFGLLQAVKASGEVDGAKELFDKGFLNKQYSFKDLYGNMDLMDKVNKLYMDKIFMPGYSGASIDNTKKAFNPDFGNNTGGGDKYIDGINYQSKIKQRLADGGRIGYNEGTPEMGMIDPKKEKQVKQMIGMGADQDLISSITGLTIEQIEFLMRENKAYGGRMGYNEGTPEMGMMASAPDPMDERNQVMETIAMDEFGKSLNELSEEEIIQIEMMIDEMVKMQNNQRNMAAMGGRMGFAMGSKPEQNAIQAAGIEGLMLNQNPAGVTELDLRETGGFIPPVGVKEKADDIPAMLANNEFVFTADAVRGMGDGDVNEGAQRMYDMMRKLEKGGRV